MSRTRTISRRSEHGGWQLAIREVSPALAPYVRGLCTYAEETPGVMQRRELPTPHVVVIFETGPRIRIYDADGRASSRYRGGFVAGLDDHPTLTEHDGSQEGVQLNFTALGARRFFGRPMAEIAGRVLHLTDLLPAEDRHVCERLTELTDRDARLDLVETLVRTRIGSHAREDGRVRWAFERIAAHGGALDIGALARELGCSHKHLIHQFRDQVGLPPKALARLVRFDRLTTILRRGGAVDWSALALTLGYCDQAHLARDVKRFTGLTPTALRRSFDALAGAAP